MLQVFFENEYKATYKQHLATLYGQEWHSCNESDFLVEQRGLYSLK
jgi:hypothetical protein